MSTVPPSPKNHDVHPLTPPDVRQNPHVDRPMSYQLHLTKRRPLRFKGWQVASASGPWGRNAVFLTTGGNLICYYSVHESGIHVQAAEQVKVYNYDDVDGDDEDDTPDTHVRVKWNGSVGSSPRLVAEAEGPRANYDNRTRDKLTVDINDEIIDFFGEGGSQETIDILEQLRIPYFDEIE